MDENLINAILQRQAAYIADLTNKNIFQEAKISVVEKQLSEMTAKYEKDQAARSKKAA